MDILLDPTLLMYAGGGLVALLLVVWFLKRNKSSRKPKRQLSELNRYPLKASQLFLWQQTNQLLKPPFKAIPALSPEYAFTPWPSTLEHPAYIDLAIVHGESGELKGILVLPENNQIQELEELCLGVDLEFHHLSSHQLETSNVLAEILSRMVGRGGVVDFQEVPIAASTPYAPPQATSHEAIAPTAEAKPKKRLFGKLKQKSAEPQVYDRSESQAVPASYFLNAGNFARQGALGASAGFAAASVSSHFEESESQFSEPESYQLPKVEEENPFAYGEEETDFSGWQQSNAEEEDEAIESFSAISQSSFSDEAGDVFLSSMTTQADDEVNDAPSFDEESRDLTSAAMPDEPVFAEDDAAADNDNELAFQWSGTTAADEEAQAPEIIASAVTESTQEESTSSPFSYDFEEAESVEAEEQYEAESAVNTEAETPDQLTEVYALSTSNPVEEEPQLSDAPALTATFAEEPATASEDEQWEFEWTGEPSEPAQPAPEIAALHALTTEEDASATLDDETSDGFNEAELPLAEEPFDTSDVVEADDKQEQAGAFDYSADEDPAAAFFTAQETPEATETSEDEEALTDGISPTASATEEDSEWQQAESADEAAETDDSMPESGIFAYQADEDPANALLQESLGASTANAEDTDAEGSPQFEYDWANSALQPTFEVDSVLTEYPAVAQEPTFSEEFPVEEDPAVAAFSYDLDDSSDSTDSDDVPVLTEDSWLEENSDETPAPATPERQYASFSFMEDDEDMPSLGSAVEADTEDDLSLSYLKGARTSTSFSLEDEDSDEDLSSAPAVKAEETPKPVYQSNFRLEGDEDESPSTTSDNALTDLIDDEPKSSS
ncbi:hypothetical protein ACKC9G_01805 [Pokkaliibacter sp. CJK22405]|uniref:hypothetical protein n=1 Tax=Pokkaliibacter sp. CJK22405 TaxID=3384615 RepID=UPI003984C36B